MTVQVKIVKERGSLRLIRCDSLGYTIVEARGGYVYSADEHHEAEAPDTPSGMVALGDKTGWMDETDARRRFDSLVERGYQLARTLW